MINDNFTARLPCCAGLHSRRKDRREIISFDLPLRGRQIKNTQPLRGKSNFRIGVYFLSTFKNITIEALFFPFCPLSRKEKDKNLCELCVFAVN
jgi:hypothetical protein